MSLSRRRFLAHGAVVGGAVMASRLEGASAWTRSQAPAIPRRRSLLGMAPNDPILAAWRAAADFQNERAVLNRARAVVRISSSCSSTAFVPRSGPSPSLRCFCAAARVRTAVKRLPRLLAIGHPLCQSHVNNASAATASLGKLSVRAAGSLIHILSAACGTNSPYGIRS